MFLNFRASLAAIQSLKAVKRKSEDVEKSIGRVKKMVNVFL